MNKRPNKTQHQLPAIRQTKTSMFRLVKANPLLTLAEVEAENQLNCVKPTPKVYHAKKNEKVVQATALLRGRSMLTAKGSGKPTSNVRRSRSAVEKHISKINKPHTKHNQDVKPKVDFRTSTPTEATAKFSKYRATPFKSTPEEIEVNDLCQHLCDWLLKNDKSHNSFYHLQNFVKSSSGFDSENKENVEHFEVERSTSYKHLNIVSGGDVLTPAAKSEHDLMKLACDALGDLYKLTLEGYPFNQSEAWLELMYNRHHIIDKQPEYWECLALIEQSRDNITAAVEYYRTAIVHGADVGSIDRLLEDLLHKFSLFSIRDDKKFKNDKRRVKVLSDARNIFKSSIINAAVHERNLKNRKILPDVLVTPARSNAY